VSFVSFYIELPVMLVMYVGWKLLKRTKWVRLDEMDLETDRYVPEELKVESGPWKGRAKEALRWLF
jgi:amino acid transporter, AAT family